MRRLLPLALFFCLPLIAQADPTPDGFHLLDFGITERLTFQTRQSGVNFSTMPSWNPGYRLQNGIDLRGYLGVTGMHSTVGNLAAIQVQAGAAYQPDAWRFYPEVLAGTQTWAISEAGTYASLSANLHYRLGLSSPDFLRVLETVTIGYTVVLVPSATDHQVTLGFRLGF